MWEIKAFRRQQQRPFSSDVKFARFDWESEGAFSIDAHFYRENWL